jgi:recombinational DNA repair protein RecR
MYRENPEEADDRQYYDYHLDRNGSSLEAENQALRQPPVISSLRQCTNCVHLRDDFDCNTCNEHLDKWQSNDL